MKKTVILHGTILSAVVLGLVACSSSQEVKQPVDMVTAAPVTVPSAAGFEAKSACGNDASYTIDGKTYQVLPSASQYKEQGSAAWYGAEYHGSETAGCEKFDMYAYSGAHRTLPIPSFVKVTNQQNGKHVIVRINDRGPFDSSDIVQLSFAAANVLGIKQQSGTPVTVEALSPEQFGNQFPQVASNTDGRSLGSGHTSDAAISEFERQKRQATQPNVDKSKAFYVVAGAWPERNQAIDMFVRLSSAGLAKTEMASAQENGRTVHQVRVGPLYQQDQIDNVKDIMQSNGLANFKVVTQAQ